MSMYESAEKINNDLNQLFFNENIKQFSTQQQETILNIIIRFGAVAKFRCRSNTAYENFVNACFNKIAKTEKVKLNQDSDFKILIAKVE